MKKHLTDCTFRKNNEAHQVDQFDWIKDQKLLRPGDQKLGRKLSIQIPNHIKVEIKTQYDLIEAISSIHILQCAKKTFQPYQSVIKDENKFRMEDQPKREYAMQINKRRMIRKADISETDPTCADLVTKVKQWPTKGSIHQVMFPCFPGSGSKWTSDLVEEISGIGAHDRYILMFRAYEHLIFM